MSENRLDFQSPRPGFVRGVAVGLLVGIALAGAGIAFAAMGRAAWDRLDPLVRGGYVAGFTDCLRLAKANDPDGWLATNYILPPVKPIQWVAKVDQLYKQKDLANSPLHQVILLAGHKLAQDTGYREIKRGDPRLERLREVLQTQRTRAATGDPEKDQTAQTAGAEDGDKAAGDAPAAKGNGDSVEAAPAGTASSEDAKKTDGEENGEKMGADTGQKKSNGDADEAAPAGAKPSQDTSKASGED